MESRTEDGKLELSLKWNNFTENIVSCLESSFGDQDFVDVTLACEGGSIKAHRLILSASSLYLRKVLKEHPCPHPVVILKGISLTELDALLVYIYHGEVRISEQDIPRLLDVAKFLEIRGLSTIHDEKNERVQIASNDTPDNINNNSNFVTSELRSMLLHNKNTDVTKKPYKQIPRLQSISQTENSLPNIKTHEDNISTTFNLLHENNQSEKLKDNNEVKVEVDDFSNDSMQYETENSNEITDENILFNQSCNSTVLDSHPQTNDISTKNYDQGSSYSYPSHKLAFYEPRPCLQCNKMYRDAATLRTHTSIMHEVLPHKISCSCGAMFLTKYDMYTHRKRGHK